MHVSSDMHIIVSVDLHARSGLCHVKELISDICVCMCICGDIAVRYVMSQNPLCMLHIHIRVACICVCVCLRARLCIGRMQTPISIYIHTYIHTYIYIYIVYM